MAGRGWRMGAGIGLAVAGIVLPGCGDDGAAADESVGSFAAFADTDAVVYAELELRPDGDREQQIEDFAAAVSGQEVSVEQLLADSYEELAAEEESLAELDFAKDVEPWLGERLAFWIGGQDSDGNPSASAMAVEVTDEEAASAAMEKALPDAEPPGASAEEGEADAPEILEQDGVAYAFFDGNLVLGDTAAVEKAAGEDEARSLRDSERFAEALQDPEAQDSSLFVYALAGRLLLSGAIDEEDITPAQMSEILDESGFDADAPSVTTLAIDAGSAVFQTSLGVEERPDLEAAEELLEDLPEDSWAAIGDVAQATYILEAFKLGVEIGLRQVANQRDITVEEARALLARQVGTDVAAGISKVEGAVAVGIEGSSPAALLGTMLASVRPWGAAADPLVAVASMLDGAIGGLKFARARPLPAGALASAIVGLPVDEPVGVRISETRDQIVAQAAGPAAFVPRGLEPRSTVEDSERLTDARDAMTDGFRATGFVDIDELLDVFPALDDGDERFGNALENLELRLGAKVEGDRFLQRLQLDVEQEATQERDALDSGNGDEDEDGEAPSADEEVS